MGALSKVRVVAAAGVLCCSCFSEGEIAYGQQNTVRAHVQIWEKTGSKGQREIATPPDRSDVVLWLRSLGRTTAATADAGPHKRFQMIQKNKSFQPHILVVPVGSTVDFPNRDPFFHNVFSLFEGKRFDLGLYEAGATNSVRFDRVGISFLFCNIHPEMSAVVIAVGTSYYGTSDRSGSLSIQDVPDGTYELHVWYERSVPKDLKALTRTVTVSAMASDLGEIRIRLNPHYSSAHKNKYGQDYAPPPSQPYSQR